VGTPGPKSKLENVPLNRSTPHGFIRSTPPHTTKKLRSCRLRGEIMMAKATRWEPARGTEIGVE
jgi:hypothetical protein